MPKASVAARAEQELVERLGYNPYEASARLVELQTKRGLTGRELAERMGSHESDVSRLRNAGNAAQRGSNLPGRQVWDKAAEALGTSSEWLLHDEGPVDVERPNKASLEDVIRALDAFSAKLDQLLEAMGATPPPDVHELVDQAMRAADRDPEIVDRLTRAIASALAPGALPAPDPGPGAPASPDPQRPSRPRARR